MYGPLLGTGEIENISPDGKQVHRYRVKDYQRFTPANDGATGPEWAADPANADLIYFHQRKFSKGTDADFDPGAGATIKCNPTVPEDRWRTDSVRDKFRSKFGATPGDRAPATSGGKDDPTLNNPMIGHGLPPALPTESRLGHLGRVCGSSINALRPPAAQIPL